MVVMAARPWLLFLDGFVALFMVVAMVPCSVSVYGGGLVSIIDSVWYGRESRRQVMSSDARIPFSGIMSSFCAHSLTLNSLQSIRLL